MPLSVLYFSSSTHIQGGAVQSMFRLARWLKQQGGTPLVVLPRRGDIVQWYQREGIEVRFIPFVELHQRLSVPYVFRYIASTGAAIVHLARLLRRERVDIVHVNEIVYYPALIAAKLAGVKTVCHVRVILEKPAWVKWLLPRLVSLFSDRVLCVSKAVQQMFSFTHKARTLYNPGPDLQRFDPGTVGSGSKFRRQWGIGPDTYVVTLVSKFSPLKGHLGLVSAAREVERRRSDLKVTYLVVGGEVPGHERYLDRVKREVEEHGLESSFVFTGVQADIPGVMAASDVVLHIPLHEDPFPGVVLEAMAMAKPVIAFDSGGIGEQFENGRSGILLEKGDTAAIAQILIDLADESELRASLGEAARRFLVSNFSAERFSPELRSVYTSLVREAL